MSRSKNGQNRNPSKIRAGFPYKVPKDPLRGNHRITFIFLCQTHPESQQPSSASRQLFSSHYHKALDVISFPQIPKRSLGNATGLNCNSGQQSVDLSPSSGRPQRQHFWGSCGWLITSLWFFWTVPPTVYIQTSLIHYQTRCFSGYSQLKNVTYWKVHSYWVAEKQTETICSTSATLFFIWGFADRSLQVFASRQDVHLYYLSIQCFLWLRQSEPYDRKA